MSEDTEGADGGFDDGSDPTPEAGTARDGGESDRPLDRSGTPTDGTDADGESDAADGEGRGEDGDWKFGLDEVGADGTLEPAAIEPEAIDLESAVFVVLGVAATVAIILRMASLIG